MDWVHTNLYTTLLAECELIEYSSGMLTQGETRREPWPVNSIGFRPTSH
jgi:hypothetical protein